MGEKRKVDLGPRYYRRVIRITAEDSPNVKLGLRQRALGIKPTGQEILPGVLSWEEYLHRRHNWHPMRQCVALDARFWEGGEVLMYPTEWVNAAHERHRFLKSAVLSVPREVGAAMGVDSAAGGDNTAFYVVDRLGVLDRLVAKTADTSVIPGMAKSLGRKWRVDPHNWVFDAGGGGIQHANLLRSQGYPVRTVGFGDPVRNAERDSRRSGNLAGSAVSLRLDSFLGRKQELEPSQVLVSGKGKDGTVHRLTRKERSERGKEDRYVYVSLRALLYHLLRLVLDPAENPDSFAIPAEYTRLRSEMDPVPLLYDGEGRIYMIPKNKKGQRHEPGSVVAVKKTLVELIGWSPDELDALCLALYGMLHPPTSQVAGSAFRRRT